MRIVFVAAAIGVLIPSLRAGEPSKPASPTLAPWVGTYQAPAEADVLKTLRPGHPRLMVLPHDLERIKQAIAAGGTAKKYYDQLLKTGEAILKEPPVQRVLIGPRLLDKSRRVVDRMYALGLLYRLDGDKKYLGRAIEELKAVAAFEDWNPSHFLDVAEMTHGFAIGYDWFYEALSRAERALIKTAIVEKGLRPAEQAHKAKKGGGWWTDNAFNWNNVCNGGITSGALAVADEEPALAAFLVAEAVKKLPNAIATYAPDGAWAEGPGYWGYATRYTVVALASLQSALGTDFGLSSLPGLSEAGLFRVYSVGPTGWFFNFADAGESSGDEPSLFWLATRYGQPALAEAARRAAGRRSSVLDLMYYDPRGTPDDLDRLPLDRHFRKADIIFLRSSWTDANATFVGLKGGDNKANHSNLDLGSFVLDAMGERWAMELSGDNYNLPAYFGNLRWTYYRMRTEGQNTLLLNGENQDAKASAPVLAFQSTKDFGYAVVDLTAGYAPVQAVKIHRGFALLDQRRSILIQDEIETQSPVDIAWAMHTRAEIKLDGNKAELLLHGKTMHARILSPANARFESVEIDLKPPQNSTKGIRKLVARLPEKTAQTRLAIAFSPAPDGFGNHRFENIQIKPLAEWIK
jgi:hypothetical protein